MSDNNKRTLIILLYLAVIIAFWTLVGTKIAGVW